MEELFEPFIFLLCQQLFSSLFPGSITPLVLPTCMGQRRGKARGDQGEKGQANRSQQKTAEEGAVLLMEQNNAFHKTIARLGGLL